MFNYFIHFAISKAFSSEKNIGYICWLLAKAIENFVGVPEKFECKDAPY